MKQYVIFNISEKSQTTIKYFLKMLSSMTETVIFMLLGTSTVKDNHVWDVPFILITIVSCLLYRALGACRSYTHLTLLYLSCFSFLNFNTAVIKADHYLMKEAAFSCLPSTFKVGSHKTQPVSPSLSGLDVPCLDLFIYDCQCHTIILKDFLEFGTRNVVTH